MRGILRIFRIGNATHRARHAAVEEKENPMTQTAFTASRSATDAKNRRLSSFDIGRADLERLKQNAAFAEQTLPGLLEQWHRRFAEWPEIQSALTHPAVHKARVEHWIRVASGRLDDGFLESAKRLATVFYENDVPGYAVALCHSTVVNGIIEALNLADDAGGSLFGRKERERKAALRATLTKVAWLDLEILLETYTEIERDSRRKMLQQLADTFEDSVKGIVQGTVAASNQMQGSAQRMAQIATATSAQSMEVSTAAEQASVNVQTAAAAAEQLTASIAEIGRHVGQSSQIANAAVKEAQRTNETVSGLVDAAQKIGEVVALINSIASQTNLLALNATIEAARAGEAGKGFAVVAQEVKSLANQTAKATEDIQNQVVGMQEAARGSADAIRGIGATITHIDEIVATVAATVEEQSGATREIARNVREAAAGTRSVTQTITGVTRASTETGTIADEVLQAATLLHRQADSLSDGVDSFLQRIRES